MKNTIIKVVAVAAMMFSFAFSWISNPAYAGTIVLHEGNNATQDIVATYSDSPEYNGRVSPNDEARSLKLNEVKPSIIGIYDDSNGGQNDDYTTITVKKQTPANYVLSSFEQSFDNDYVNVQFHRNNGLDGNVSYITIKGTGT